MNINITVSVADATLILQSLAQMPYAKVAGLVSNLQDQCQTQVDAQTKASSGPDLEVAPNIVTSE